LSEKDSWLAPTLSHPRLPWVAASAIPVAVSLAVLLLGKFVLFPSFLRSANNLWYLTLYGDVDYAVGLAVPILVGFLFRLKFEYSPRGIFLTCAASTYVMILAEFLALFGSSPGSTLFDFLWSFAASVFWALLGALLIVAGSGLGRIVLARRQVPPA
jgi:hypothetical protein